MEPITMITLIVTFVGALAIGYAKFYERKISSGETWSDQKFGMFFLVALALMAMTYFLSGGTSFPEEETLNAVYMLIEPIAALFGLTVATITGGRILKQKVVAPVVAPAAPVTTEPVGIFPVDGCEVTPSIGGKIAHLTYEHKSPLTVDFALEGTQPTSDHQGYTSAIIDWDDGTSQPVTLINGKATVTHTFNFIKTEKYTGKTFNPVFTFLRNDGQKFVVNGDRRSIDIGVIAE